jgi:hypothetical protein
MLAALLGGLTGEKDRVHAYARHGKAGRSAWLEAVYRILVLGRRCVDIDFGPDLIQRCFALLSLRILVAEHGWNGCVPSASGSSHHALLLCAAGVTTQHCWSHNKGRRQWCHVLQGRGWPHRVCMLSCLRGTVDKGSSQQCRRGASK